MTKDYDLLFVVQIKYSGPVSQPYEVDLILKERGMTVLLQFFIDSIHLSEQTLAWPYRQTYLVDQDSLHFVSS